MFLSPVFLSENLFLFDKRPCGRVVSAPDFGSRGPGFETHLKRNSVHEGLVSNYIVFHFYSAIVSI